MGDSPVFSTIKNVAGYGVGTLAALDTIKSGGLGSYLMNRQRMMSDPGFRASLAGSPFAAGVFGVSGATGPAPAAPGALPAAGGQQLVQPAEMVGPPPPGVQVAQPGQTGALPAPTAQNVPGYMPGTPRAWMPNLPPYDPKQALEQQGLATSQVGLTDPDAGRRGQFKMAAGIPLNDDEIIAVGKRGVGLQTLGGPGTVVKLDIPGMTTTIGSPYTAMGDVEYPSYAVAAAAAAARNASIPPGNPQWTVVPSGRDTFLLSPPATAAQVAPPAPAPVRAPAPAPAPAPPVTAAPVPPPPPPTPPPAPPPAGIAAPQPERPLLQPPPTYAPPGGAPPAPPPTAPPMAAAGAPEIYATPGRAPAYVPPGLPEMAPSVRVAPGSPPMGGRVAYPSAAFVEEGGGAPPAPPAPPPAAPAAAVGGRGFAPARGNTVAIRNNNPGNITAGPATRGYPGVVGTETVGSHTFLTFDSPESGFAAMERLLQGPGYRNLPFDQGMRRWTTGTTAPTFEDGRPAGYDLPAMQRNLGIDPSQRIGSLPLEQRAALVREMATREGYPARAASQVGAQPAAMYASVAQPGGPIVAFPSAAFLDTSGAAAPAGAPGAVGYPPPAPQPVDYRGLPFRRTVPDLTPRTLGLPAPRMLFPAPAAGAPGPGPLVEPGTEAPLEKLTVHDPNKGTDYTYAVPSQPSPSQAANMKLAGFDDFRRATAEQIRDWKQREDADAAQKKQIDADIARARGAKPDDLLRNQTMYNTYRGALDQLLIDFPNPEDRAKYIGWTNQTWREIHGHIADDPRFNLFMNELDPFQYRDIKGAIDEGEQHRLANLLPTGREANASDFEERLQQFNDHVNFQLGLLNAEMQAAPNELNSDWWNAVGQYRRAQLTADKQQLADQLGGSVAGAYVGAALGAPAAGAPAAPPPAAPPVAAPAPAAPPPFTVLGHWQE